jgi:hypothetical protein
MAPDVSWSPLRALRDRVECAPRFHNETTITSREEQAT